MSELAPGGELPAALLEAPVWRMLPDYTGFVALLSDHVLLGCPTCHRAMGFVYVVQIIDEAAGLCRWVYRCSTCHQQAVRAAC